MGAVFPGLLLGFLYLAYIIVAAYLKPSIAPLPKNAPDLEWKIVAGVLKNILPPMFLILAVLGSIFAGVATPTEASGVGALGAIMLAVYYKKLTFPVFKSVSLDAYRTTSYIFMIFIGATMFALVLRELGGDELIERGLTSLPFGPYGVLIAILLIVFLLGFLLDWIEITLIALPLLAPVILGLDFNVEGYGVLDEPKLIWFVMLVAITLQTSFLTPPVGFALFYLKGVCPPEVKLMDIYKGVIPFIILQLVGLSIVIALPAIVTWLPAYVYGN
jgi:tripartite ATP-independent transporter DctM subunit